MQYRKKASTMIYRSIPIILTRGNFHKCYVVKVLTMYKRNYFWLTSLAAQKWQFINFIVLIFSLQYYIILSYYYIFGTQN